MSVSWPSNVPNVFKNDSDSGSFKPQVLRTSMDKGPVKTRRKDTRLKSVISGQIIMSQTEFNSFVTWFNTSLGAGSLSFLFLDPYTDIEKEWIFTKEPKFKKIALTHRIVSLEMEEK